MARFDVYKRRGGEGYLLDCQADLLSHLSTRLIVPLLPTGAAPRSMSRLNPMFLVEDKPHVMRTDFAAAMPRAQLGRLVQNLQEQEHAIIGAFDLLITGV